MATTVAAIADEAFDGVAAEITGVIQTCTLTRTTLGTYNTSTGSHATTPATDTGRAIFDTSTKLEDALPGYVAGPTERLVWVEGLTTLDPKEGDKITIPTGGTDYEVKAAGDIAGAGSFFALAVVPK